MGNKPRKTFEITGLQKLVNGQLASGEISQDAKAALCVLLERVLMDAEAYGGFGNL